MLCNSLLFAEQGVVSIGTDLGDQIDVSPWWWWCGYPVWWRCGVGGAVSPWLPETLLQLAWVDGVGRPVRPGRPGRRRWLCPCTRLTPGSWIPPFALRKWFVPPASPCSLAQGTLICNRENY